jgi:hypothetical protein
MAQADRQECRYSGELYQSIACSALSNSTTTTTPGHRSRTTFLNSARLLIALPRMPLVRCFAGQWDWRLSPRKLAPLYGTLAVATALGKRDIPTQPA